jgi:hypothetical protein
MVYKLVTFNSNGVRLSLAEKGVDHIQQDCSQVNSNMEKHFQITRKRVMLAHSIRTSFKMIYDVTLTIIRFEWWHMLLSTLLISMFPTGVALQSYFNVYGMHNVSSFYSEIYKTKYRRLCLKEFQFLQFVTPFPLNSNFHW